MNTTSREIEDAINEALKPVCGGKKLMSLEDAIRLYIKPGMTLNQSKERFTHELSYITGIGDRVTTAVSSMGVFRKSGSGEELRLEACFPDGGERSIPKKVKEVENNCGWPLAKVLEVVEIVPPTPDELELLRWLVLSTTE